MPAVIIISGLYLQVDTYIFKSIISYFTMITLTKLAYVEQILANKLLFLTVTAHFRGIISNSSYIRKPRIKKLRLMSE